MTDTDALDHVAQIDQVIVVTEAALAKVLEIRNEEDDRQRSRRWTMASRQACLQRRKKELIKSICNSSILSIVIIVISLNGNSDIKVLLHLKRRLKLLIS